MERGGGHSGGGQGQGRVRPWPLTVAASAGRRAVDGGHGQWA